MPQLPKTPVYTHTPYIFFCFRFCFFTKQHFFISLRVLKYQGKPNSKEGEGEKEEEEEEEEGKAKGFKVEKKQNYILHKYWLQ